ncbi:hypothetical protein [Caballeronia ptereochthonis]|uniref:Uncharacterized protein n=1 Tax=Caballeronia ptereochthonis TaxID=1777144 RepID=A0A158E0L4_9BURK|nr:hypothetical protein [Caballeronia ptereochthonis]SAL00392.1 hypothetical protein AWB83_06236 [Caballeronia ptereochthonis]
MSTRFKIIACLAGFLFISNLCLADEALPKDGKPVTNAGDSEAVVQVLGRDSIVEQLNMGPNATAFWRDLQAFMSHLEMLEDFSKIAHLFGFTVKDRLDLIIPTTPVPAYRSDISDGKYQVAQNIEYRVLSDGRTDKVRIIKLTMTLDVNRICLSALEVRRVFGRGKVYAMVPGWVPPEPQASVFAGAIFGELYGDATDKVNSNKLSIVYAASGCVADIFFQRVIRLP